MLDIGYPSLFVSNSKTPSLIGLPAWKDPPIRVAFQRWRLCCRCSRKSPYSKVGTSCRFVVHTLWRTYFWGGNLLHRNFTECTEGNPKLKLPFNHRVYGLNLAVFASLFVGCPQKLVRLIEIIIGTNINNLSTGSRILNAGCAGENKGFERR